MSLQKKSALAIAREWPHLLVIGLCSFTAIFCLAVSWATLRILMFSQAAGSLPVAVATACIGVALVLEIFVALYGHRELHKRAELFASAQAAKAQTDELFDMTDMLQSAEGYDDAAAVLMATAQRLLPEFGAALYIFNNSRDRLDLAGSWNMPADYQPSDSLAPSNCWALKRGKPHTNDPSNGTLCCAHHCGAVATLEVPMMARGAVYGLLMFATGREKAQTELADISRLCHALADSMSLALSNISLREKLRTQSLRDPLTGLYNRRYMEDALERYISLAERGSGSTAVLMLDLDNFKRLNDEHGHAKGDAVLRDVAAQLVGGLRPSDVVCRYGGEELLVILPNCSLDEAKRKADTLRLRIAGLSEAHDAAVSASFGVASVPETSTSASDLVPMADAALYEAKRLGKNCVACAERRAGREEHQPRLAVTS
ncbi:MAG: GGDEF domain-containing protein [Sphingomonas sp.]